MTFARLVLLSAAFLATAWAQNAGVELPAAARKVLESRYSKCTLAPSAPQIDDWFRVYRIPYRPVLTFGDFDDDGSRDYAVQIVCPGPKGPEQTVVALMARGKGFDLHLLTTDPADPFTFLYVYRKGEKDFDFETMKPFRYETDSLGVLYFAKTAVTYRWLGKAFEGSEAPGDEEVEAAREEQKEEP